MDAITDKYYWQKMWDRFKEGDKEAFADFYNEHIDRLYRYGLKICSNEDTVKDAIQEVFLDLYLKRDKNKSTPENLRYYLLLALKRILIRALKTSRRFDHTDLSNMDIQEYEFSIEYEMIKKEQIDEQRVKVIDALDQLPAKQKEAVYLRFNEGMDYPKIASLLGINIESARKHIYRALKTVKEIVDSKSITTLFYFFQKKLKKTVHI